MALGVDPSGRPQGISRGSQATDERTPRNALPTASYSGEVITTHEGFPGGLALGSCPGRGGPVGVGWRGGHRGVFALSEIPRGAAIVSVRGTIVRSPTRLSLQVGRNRHLVDCGPIVDAINHSCSGNAFIDFDGLVMRSKRTIHRGQEVRINYCATEESLCEPFFCDCMSEGCYGYVAGHLLLSDEQLARIVDDLSPYLMRISALRLRSFGNGLIG